MHSSRTGRVLAGWKKALLGILVALLLLAGVEVGAHVLFGVPPGYDAYDRLNYCRLQDAGAQVVLSCDGGMDVRTFPRQHDRPRVVFLGASSVWEPPGASFPDKVASRLPGVDVLNLAVPGIKVASVLRIASDLELLTPDLVVVYAGHNEYSQDVFTGRITASRL